MSFVLDHFWGWLQGKPKETNTYFLLGSRGGEVEEVPLEKKYFASSNPYPPHSRAYDRYNTFLRILETSTPNSHRPFWTLSETRLASCSGGILARSTDECWRRSGSAGYLARQGIGILGGIHLRGHSAGSTELLCDTQRDARRDPLAGCSGGILGGVHAPLDPLLWDTQRGTRRDPLAGCSGYILGRVHWRAALAGYSAGSTGEQLWRDTRWDPLASRSGGILGIHWRAALAGYAAGSTGEPLWRDTRDPLASRSGGILGVIHWRAALAGYSAGSTGKHVWRDTGRDPLSISSGRILGGIHWRAALAGYSAGSTGELLWRDTRRVPLASCSGGIMAGGAWCRSIANNADSNIKSNNPFLSGGEKATRTRLHDSIEAGGEHHHLIPRIRPSEKRGEDGLLGPDGGHHLLKSIWLVTNRHPK